MLTAASPIYQKMATITASNAATLVVRAGVGRHGFKGVSSPILGLPAMAKKGRVRCSLEEKAGGSEVGWSSISMGASLMAAASAATASAGPAMALVDDRMSTEGTGLPFGLSNNLLLWILLGVFGLIWALYFTYTATLEEDDESGLSL